LRLFKDLASEFLEFIISGVIIDVVISVFGAFKFYDKCVRDAILHNAISTYRGFFGGYFHRRTILGKTKHTWIPSDELSVPPDADLIYGLLEVG
jgi:6-phosphogluconate dehydrogenase